MIKKTMAVAVLMLTALTVGATEKRFDSPDGKMTVRDAIPPSIYETQENLKPIRWSLCEDTMVINGYLCKTAICQLHGRKWTVRYSEDIDLVQVEPGPVKPITERLGKVLSWLPRMTSEMRRFGFRMKFRYESEIAPIEPMRLKVEVNTFEHFLFWAMPPCRLK